MKSKRDCLGCTEDFYNGKNPYGIVECAHFRSAILVLKKRVHVDQRPPWRQQPRNFLSCRREKGYVFVKPNQEY